MGSDFETHMAAANTHILEKFKDAEQVTVTPVSGDAFDTDAILGPISGDIVDDDQGEMKVKIRKVSFAEPDGGAVYMDAIITIGSEPWIVTEVLQITSGMVDVQCQWNQAQSKHGDMHKRRAEI